MSNAKRRKKGRLMNLERKKPGKDFPASVEQAVGSSRRASNDAPSKTQKGKGFKGKWKEPYT